MRKYVVVGAGGTGGTLGAYLANAGMDVTFIARGEHLQVMKEKGLRILRPKDELVISPCKACTFEEYRDIADVVFVCVKGYSLDSVIPKIKEIVDEHSVVIPILNIFGTGRALQRHFEKTLVTDGCIYVAAQIESPGVVRMNGDILRVFFGVRDPAEYREELKEIEADLVKSGITGVLSDNIARDALLKLSYVSPQGACGLYYNVPAGEIQKPGEIRDCFAGLVHEIDLLAETMGIRFEEDIVKRNLEILDQLSETATTSMQRDVMEGKPSEIDGLVYEIVRLAEGYGLELPYYRKIAKALKERITEDGYQEAAKMVSFESDYIAGAHPEILKRLGETNLESLSGYGSDKYCENAKAKIRKAVGMEDADVEFLVGGTQANAVIISTMLKDYEGVIAAKTGHIGGHEAGAIEYTGHKVLELPEKEGKIAATDLSSFLADFYGDANHEHMVFPGMVYISFPTEYGTLYSKKELEEIYDVCKKYEIPLFIDGARLGYGLMSRRNDVTLHDLATLCDVFYIGGTKVGALCGEAVVFTKKNRPQHFMTSVKKRGALLAKGRLMGVQFDTLFTDDLYFRIGTYAIDMAEELKKIFQKHGLELFLDSPTNQQFVVLENKVLEKLRENVAVSFWEKKDEDHTVVRLATSWSTTKEDLEVLDQALSKMAF